MTRKNRNIAIIGGGHNSLVSAAYLAKAGFNVELFESRSEVGGMASTKELVDGYKVPGVAHLLHQTDTKIHKSSYVFHQNLDLIIFHSFWNIAIAIAT